MDEKTLKEIINTAVLAPSAFNLQPWRIIAVGTDESKAKLYPLVNRQEKIKDAPYTLIIIGNKNGWDETNPVWKEMLQSFNGNEQMVSGAKKSAALLYGTSDERKIKFAESNTGLLAMSIIMASKEMGIDSHAMSGIDFDGIHKAFGLKEHESVVMLICLGYFDNTKQLYPRRPRRTFDEITTIV